MANHDIIIELGKPNFEEPHRSTLELSDKGTTSIRSGDTVTWVIKDKEISSILVMDDNRHSNVFLTDPRPGKDGATWVAEAKGNIKKVEVETYTICWAQGGKVFCYDPVIVLNP
jgi:hypothetical protein